MSEPLKKSDQTRAFELVISTILRAGVISSLAIVLIGLVVSFVHHPGYLSSPSFLKQITTPGRIVPHSLHEVITGVAALHGEAIITAGLLLLIATPVARVAVSIIAFLLERDWVFTLVTAFVLAMLILSFFLGRVE